MVRMIAGSRPASAVGKRETFLWLTVLFATTQCCVLGAALRTRSAYSDVMAGKSITQRAAALILLALTLAAPALASPHRKLGRVLVTFYWVVDESSPRYRGNRDATLRDARGRVIARTTAKFRRDVLMEGTGWLRDGRTVMYYRKVGGENRFRITRAKYGLSVTGRPLVPYRTIAVDRRFVKLGSTICIPQLKGTRLPDGTIHDGLFVASDTGRFRGAHIDIFTGAGPKASAPFVRRGYGSRSRVTIYHVTDRRHTDCVVTSRGKP